VETLAAQIARDGKLGPNEAGGWVLRLAKRLEATHRQGLVHGNVSAYCLLVESRNPLSRGLLIDVPRQAEPTFHSPERATTGSTSQADDAWALAVTFFFALTGQYPFPGGSDAEVKQRVAAGPPRLARVGMNDTALQGFFDQVFARDIARRQSSVETLRQAIERWVRDPAIAQLPGLEDDDEDQPTMMRAQVSIGSAKQAPDLPAPVPLSASPGNHTLLGMGTPPPPSAPLAVAPLPAAGRPAPLPAAGLPPLAPAGVPLPQGMLPAPGGYPMQPPMHPGPSADASGPIAGMPMPPPGIPPMAGPQMSARAAPTILQVRPPAPSGMSSGTMALLAAVWLVVTFGGAAVEYIVLTRM
jgi:hypothetical protein